MEELSAALRPTVAAAWTLRHRVELEAEQRFARLGDALSELDSHGPFAAQARKASDDERRHAVLCAQLARAYGAPSLVERAEPARIAPSRLSTRQRLLYELVAACCITETESVATVTTLLAAEEVAPDVERALREIARDEVTHSRLGWGYLSHERAQGDVSFLAEWIPAMLEGAVAADVFREDATSREDAERLLVHGVLAPARKRDVFVRSLQEVILPGLEHLGVSSALAREWLAQRSPGHQSVSRTTLS